MAKKPKSEKQADDNLNKIAKNPPNPKGPREIGGPKGLEPTRYGDWERKGIISDF